MGPNWQTFVILFILVVVLFGGRGRISSIMGDMASGIKSFKKGLADEDEAKAKANDTAALSEDTPVNADQKTPSKTE